MLMLGAYCILCWKEERPGFGTAGDSGGGVGGSCDGLARRLLLLGSVGQLVERSAFLVMGGSSIETRCFLCLAGLYGCCARIDDVRVIP